jgi:hypothetical protein
MDNEISRKGKLYHRDLRVFTSLLVEKSEGIKPFWISGLRKETRP